MMSSRSVFWLFRHVRFIDLLAWSWPWMVIVWMLSCGFFNMSGEPCYLFLHHCQLHVPSYCALTCTARWRQLTQYNCSSMFMSCGSVLWCPEWNFTEELIILESRGCLCPIDLKPGVPWGPEGQGLAGLQAAAGPIGGELCDGEAGPLGEGDCCPTAMKGQQRGRWRCRQLWLKPTRPHGPDLPAAIFSVRWGEVALLWHLLLGSSYIGLLRNTLEIASF